MSVARLLKCRRNVFFVSLFYSLSRHGVSESLPDLQYPQNHQQAIHYLNLLVTNALHHVPVMYSHTWNTFRIKVSSISVPFLRYNIMYVWKGSSHTHTHTLIVTYSCTHICMHTCTHIHQCLQPTICTISIFGQNICVNLLPCMHNNYTYSIHIQTVYNAYADSPACFAYLSSS